MLSTLTSIIFICATVSFVLAGISSLRALTAREYYSYTENDVHKYIRNNYDKLRWFAEGTINTKLNDYSLTIKTNWLWAAEKHFLYAILYLAVGIILLFVKQFFN